MPAPETLEQTWAGIHSMAIRGASRISVVAAAALANHAASLDVSDWKSGLRAAAARLASARPTAVALENGLAAVASPALAASSRDDAAAAALAAARGWQTRLEAGRGAIARAGADALPRAARVLTHCHSRTAVAVLAEAHRAGTLREVLATETRPWRQGLITVRELAAEGVSSTLIVDSAAGHFLREGAVDAVLVGADTVCRDGTLINKIGTSTVALAAREAGVPVLCATSFCKFSHRMPAEVQVEERSASEVARPDELPAGVQVLNPVFDRTPAAWVRHYVTEDGVHRPHDAVRLALRDIPKVMPW